MRVQDIMSTNVVSISPDTRAGEAREKLRDHEIDHLVVIESGRVLGVLSQRDLARTPDDAPARAVMSRKVATIAPSATIRRAAGVMRGRAVGCLPVVDKTRLVGIITTSDLLTAISKGEIHPGPPQGERFLLRKRGIRKRPMPI